MAKHTTELYETARALLARGKSIVNLAGSIKELTQRFDDFELVYTPGRAAAFRHALLTTPRLNTVVSAVTLPESSFLMPLGETTAPNYLRQQNIIAGVKLNLEDVRFLIDPDETISTSLKGLNLKLNVFKETGIRYVELHVTFKADDYLLLMYNISVKVPTLAVLAKMCQEAGLVPVIRIEVLSDGNHIGDVSADTLESVLFELFEVLENQEVRLDEMVLSTNIIVPGPKNDDFSRASPGRLADLTVQTLLWSGIPEDIAGIAFTSDRTPAHTLLSLGYLARESLPWKITANLADTSYCTALLTWARTGESITQTQAAFIDQLKMVSHACKGRLVV